MSRGSSYGSAPRVKPPLPSLRNSTAWFIDSVASTSQNPSPFQSATANPESTRLERVSTMACRSSRLASERLK